MRSHRPNNKSDFLMGAQGQVRQQGHHEQSLFLRWNQQLMYFFVEYLTTYVFVPHNTTLCVVLCYTDTYILCYVYNYVHISCHIVCLWRLCIGCVSVPIGWGGSDIKLRSEVESNLDYVLFTSTWCCCQNSAGCRKFRLTKLECGSPEPYWWNWWCFQVRTSLPGGIPKDKSGDTPTGIDSCNHPLQRRKSFGADPKSAAKWR